MIMYLLNSRPCGIDRKHDHVPIQDHKERNDHSSIKDHIKHYDHVPIEDHGGHVST